MFINIYVSIIGTITVHSFFNTIGNPEKITPTFRASEANRWLDGFGHFPTSPSF